MRVYVGTRERLTESKYLIIPVKYKNRDTSAIVFYLENQLYAYVNHCMHMQRPLDCQEDNVFDSEGKLLRCSMHGFVFEPTNGECLSPVCAGEKLQALKTEETVDGKIFLNSKYFR